MQYLNVTNDLKNKTKAKPVPPEEYENRTVYVQFNIEWGFLWTSLLKDVPGNFCVGVL